MNTCIALIYFSRRGNDIQHNFDLLSSKRKRHLTFYDVQTTRNFDNYFDRDYILSSLPKCSNRDSTKLNRDVADIRRACAVRDLGNGGCAAATSAIAVAVPDTRPERPALTPATARACRSLLTTGIRR